MKKIAFFFIMSIGLVSCSPRISEVNSSDAQEVVAKMIYTQDPRTGICYSIIRSGKIDSFTDATISHAAVPCEKVPAALLSKR